MNSSMKNPAAWEEVTPDISNLPGQRTPTAYINTVKQFEVETNPRYAKGHSSGEETYCNIFLWDVTKAMNCEVPHWVDPSTGVEVPIGKGKELSANGVCDWFTTHALKYDWMKCGKKKAMDRASNGFPTVVLWRNLRGIGHVAIVLPGMDYMHIAQAGGSNFFDKNIITGFGNLEPLLFYTHD